MYQVTVFDKFDCVSFVTEHNTLESAKEEASRFKNTLIEEVEEDIVEQLLDILPNGSGINFDYEILHSRNRTNKANITIRFFSSNEMFELLTNMNTFYNIKFVYNNDDGELNHIIKFNRCILRKIYSLQTNDHLMIVAEFTSEEGKEKLFENICE